MLKKITRRVRIWFWAWFQSSYVTKTRCTIKKHTHTRVLCERYGMYICSRTNVNNTRVQQQKKVCILLVVVTSLWCRNIVHIYLLGTRWYVFVRWDDTNKGVLKALLSRSILKACSSIIVFVSEKKRKTVNFEIYSNVFVLATNINIYTIE